MSRVRFIFALALFSNLAFGCARQEALENGLSASNGPTGAIAGWTTHISCRNSVVDPPTTTRELARSEPVICEMLDNGKKYFRLGQYGLAEQSYRKAIETNAGSNTFLNKTAQMEAMLGLAATYDQLKRFDLADKIYAQFRQKFGRTTAYENNYGYSLLLRGDTKSGNKHLKIADEKMFKEVEIVK